MDSWLLRFLEGAALAAPATLSPGPLQAYLLARTLQSGVRGAVPAAFAPLFSDILIITVVVLLLRTLPARGLELLRLLGGGILILLAVWIARSPTPELSTTPRESAAAGRKSLGGAIALNLVNPNPYLFWAIVGGPILLKSWSVGAQYAAAFLVGFYGAFVSGLALTVVLFATVGRFDARLHRPLCWVAATALAGFGVVQIVHSVRTLGV